MATTTITNAARLAWLQATIDMANDVFRIALYNGSLHDANQGVYTATPTFGAEASGTGYSAAGEILATVVLTQNTTANVSYVDWSVDPTWTTSTITATDCMIYDDTHASNLAVYIGDMSGSKSSSSGTFTVILPGGAASTAIIRIA